MRNARRDLVPLLQRTAGPEGPALLQATRAAWDQERAAAYARARALLDAMLDVPLGVGGSMGGGMGGGTGGGMGGVEGEASPAGRPARAEEAKSRV
mmetsp:Transcript_13715/g.54270  ORF Transcript_13715/g.54270 Transcript_13715/m.54270 type:complete len:96 (-) Transcript_13715:1483-1770(-)